MSSCLGDDDPIEYSPNALVQAFSLDNVLGVNYAFTIDQISGRIYNQDSLPVGSDTIINKILITKLTTPGYAFTIDAAGNDSAFNLADSINLVNTMETLPNGDPGKPFRFRVHAPDWTHIKEYSVSVRVHQQQPDSLNWGKGPVATLGITGKQKSIIFNGKIFNYAASSTWVHYATPSNGQFEEGDWRASTVSGLPSTDITSIVNFNNMLYATIFGSTKVYSSNDGINWEEAPAFGENTVALISPIGNILTGIKTFDNQNKFCTTTDGSTWVEEGAVPQNFPINNMSVTSFNSATGVPNIMVVGNIPEENITANDTATVAWGYMTGQEWAPLTSSAPCPLLTDPSILHYGGDFYIFGKDFKTFYKSRTGLEWNEVKSRFMFPLTLEIKIPDEEGTPQIERYFGFRDEPSLYSMVVDEENFIWITRSEDDRPGAIVAPSQTWRGRLNRLGFARQ